MQLPSRRQRCESEMRPSVRRLVEKPCLGGFTREEALIAISDATDAELAEATDRLADGGLMSPDTVLLNVQRH